MHADVAVRYSKKNAIQLIKKHRLLWPLSGAGLMLFLSFFGIAFLTDYFVTSLMKIAETNTRDATIWAYSLTVVFSLLVLPQFWYGLKNAMIRCLFSGRLDFGGAFSCFADRRRYFFVFRYALGRALRFHLCCAFALVLSALAHDVGEYLLLVGREACAILVFFGTCLALLLIACAYFTMCADSFLVENISVTAPELSYTEARRLSARRMKDERRALCQLNLSFLPLWGLSVLLLGIPLFFIVPYYIVARAILANQCMKV